MRGLGGVLVLAIALSAAPAHAEDAPLAWDAHRPIADWISYGLVGLNLTMETVHAIQAPDRAQALWCETARIGLTMGVTEIIKRTAHRDRPDHSDDKSVPSGHMALAVVTSGWRVNVSIPIAIGAGYTRTAAAKHHVSDVLAGAGIGWASRFICRGGRS